MPLPSNTACTCAMSRRLCNMAAKPIFIGGTSSNAGKSWMATALCAWLRRQGVAVAPFKAQNMSNNSYPCRSGGEIGRAQVVQAEACGLEPELSMNPILLKPNGAGASQVIVNGRVWQTMTPREYYQHADELRGRILAAYQDLARRFDVIVIEGAGSVSELNLREFDLVNLGLVTRLNSPWLLVADIERGGVFASVIGTVSVLTTEERALLRGFAINKFRGDTSLFEAGVRILETRTQSHCFGVFPYLPEVTIDAEDSLALPTHLRTTAPPGAAIGIIQFPCISNATDFRLLTWADWLMSPSSCDYDFVILPGSKNTIADLQWLRSVGLDDWILSRHRHGATIVGICGGFQMLGRLIRDPSGIESSAGIAEGLGLLPAETVLSAEKTIKVRTATTRGGVRFNGYEIHLGVTTLDPPVAPFAQLDDERFDGACMNGVVGTYLHGALESAEVCAELLGVSIQEAMPKREHYQRLADWLDRSGRGLSQLGVS
jgi:adenosylcobyric acid synthase